MLNFNLVYYVMIFIALAQWGYMRLLMSRGLEKEFHKFRQTRSMHYFFERFLKPYLLLMSYTALYVLFVAYCALQLLSNLAILSLETTIFVILAMIFFIKDRVYYVTALYVLSKKGEDA